MGELTLILGGARSGKSTYAEQLAAGHGGQVVYIATAQALDEEMAGRILKHQEIRPGSWRTVEIPRNIAATLSKEMIQGDVFLLDCVTLWVTNLLMATADEEFEPDEAQADKLVTAEIEQLLELIRVSKTDWIIVSNEVGLGLVPPYPLGRVYRDLLGRTNRQLAAAADEVFFLVAGIPVPLHAFRKA